MSRVHSGTSFKVILRRPKADEESRLSTGKKQRRDPSPRPPAAGKAQDDSKNGFLAKMYRRLFRHYGPQGWWPTTSGRSLTPVYTPRRSLRTLTERQKFEVCLGAILTQNTSWSNVMRALRLLKSHGHLNFKAVCGCSCVRLEKYVRSSGYFRQKAARVRGFLNQIKTKAKGRFDVYFQGPTPALREKLLEIKGIGPETADSMLLYAAGRPVFVVDAYTRRIGQRWGILKGSESYDEVQNVFTSALPRSPTLFGEFHALLVQLGKEVCRKVPLCHRCPLRRSCPTGVRRRFKVSS